MEFIGPILFTVLNFYTLISGFRAGYTGKEPKSYLAIFFIFLILALASMFFGVPMGAGYYLRSSLIVTIPLFMFFLGGTIGFLTPTSRSNYRRHKK